MANKDKLLTNAQKFLSKGKIAKAISEYQTLVTAFPKDVRNRQRLAELYIRDKRQEAALTEYESVAKHYADTGFYLKAIAVYKQIQKIEPSRTDIYHQLAELNEKQGLIGNALTEYRNLIAFYDENMMHQEAIGVLEKMLVLHPGNLAVSARIAEFYKVSGQNDRAFETFRVLIDALSEKGEHSKIIKLYDSFLDICPEDGTSSLPLARALLHSDSPDKAVQLLKTLLKYAPEDYAINQCLTDAYVASGAFGKARLVLEPLLKQKEADLDLRENYLRICLDAGEKELARDRLEEWKDSFFQAERLTALQDFYEELKACLSGDPVVAATLSVIYAAVEATAKQDKLEDPPAQVKGTSPPVEDELESVQTVEKATTPEDEVEVEIEIDINFDGIEDLVLEATEEDVSEAAVEVPVDDLQAAGGRPVSLEATAASDHSAEPAVIDLVEKTEVLEDIEELVELEEIAELAELAAVNTMAEISRGRQEAEAVSENSPPDIDLISDLQAADLLATDDFFASIGDVSQEDNRLSPQLVSDLDSSDTESHYNLGIAYKEMGLYDNAIVEFVKAEKDPIRSIDSITLIGQCHREAGATDAAKEAFKRGLKHEDLTDEGRLALNFELGSLHQLNGQLLEALECFQLVAEKDSFFRDVSALVENLRRELGLGNASDDSGPEGNRDRVSYV